MRHGGFGDWCWNPGGGGEDQSRETGRGSGDCCWNPGGRGEDQSRQMRRGFGDQHRYPEIDLVTGKQERVEGGVIPNRNQLYNQGLER